VPSKKLLIVLSCIVITTLDGCGGGSGDSNLATAAPPASSPSSPGSAASPTAAPYAAVQAPSTVISYSNVLLDGTVSRGPSSPVISYEWVQTAGPPVILNGATTSQATFTAPPVTKSQTVTFALKVTDVASTSSTATQSIDVIPASVEQLKPQIVSVKLLETFSGNDHNDVSPIAGPPQSGTTISVQLSLGGAITSPLIQLVDSSGVILSKLKLKQTGDPALQPLNYFGPITIPSVPFQFKVSGTTNDLQTFNLLSEPMLPMNMTVFFSPRHVLLPRGATATTNLSIRNSGPSAVFRIQVSDPSGLVTSIGNTSIPVDTGGTASVEISVALPTNSPGLIAPSISARASVPGDASRSGAAEFKIWVNGTP